MDRSGEFYLSRYEIRFGLRGADVEHLLDNLRSAPIDHRAVFMHEVRHFLDLTGTTFGLYSRMLGRVQWMSSIRLSVVLRSLGYSPQRPLLTMCERLTDELDDTPELPRELTGHTSFARSTATMHNALYGRGDLSERDFTKLQLACAFALAIWRTGDSYFDAPSFNRDYPDGADMLEVGLFERYRLDKLPPTVNAQIERALDTVRTRIKGASNSDIVLSCTPQWLLVESTNRRGDTEALLEGAAFVAEMLFRIAAGGYKNDVPQMPPSPYADSYLAMLGAFGRPLVLPGLEAPAYLALADLALNPCFDCECMMLCERQGGLMDNLPPWRFKRAVEVAVENVGPPDDLGTWVEEPDDTYCSWIEAICDELGWLAPWQTAERVIEAADSWPYVELHETQFLRACSMRVEHPALLPTWPLHPFRSDALAYIGLPNMAAADTGFKYHVTIEPTTDGGAYRYKWDGERPDPAAARLMMELAFIDVAVQLLYHDADLELDTDPRRVVDEYADLERTAMRRVLKEMMLPAEYWPDL
jgi:hypothetical protein